MAQFTLYDLEQRVKERGAAGADASYTRRLLDQGVAHRACGRPYWADSRLTRSTSWAHEVRENPV